MSLTVELAPELESRLRAEAAEKGLDASAYISLVLREHVLGLGQQPAAEGEKLDFKAYLLSAPDLGLLEIERSRDLSREVELQD